MRLYFALYIQSEIAIRKVTDDVASDLYTTDSIFYHTVVIATVTF